MAGCPPGPPEAYLYANTCVARGYKTSMSMELASSGRLSPWAARNCSRQLLMAPKSSAGRLANMKDSATRTVFKS